MLEQNYLVTLLVKLGVVASLASILARSNTFKGMLMRESRTLNQRLQLALWFSGIFGASVATRVFRSSYDAVDLGLEGSLLSGILGGYVTGLLSGILISPLTTIYYDSGFLIGLKGFVGAIVGGLVSYPIAAAGALMVGLLESFSSFWWSAFKEVIVFTLIIPVLLWRSLRTVHVDGDDE